MVGGGALKRFTPRFLLPVLVCGINHLYLSCFNYSNIVFLKYQGNKVLIQTKE
nr:MAG TPA: hypothetical protein [Caudoviricetes sp.]